MFTELEYVATLDFRIKYAQENIEKFQKEFAKNPYSSIDGMDEMFDLIAQHNVDTMIRTAIVKNSRKVTDIHKYAIEQVLKGAYYCPMSTSQTSNLMARFTTKAWARITEEIKGS
jgi:hypothetical protein